MALALVNTDDDVDPVYYKLYHKDNDYAVVCMQWFDEFDYNKDNFITHKKFYNEQEAEIALDHFELIVKIGDASKLTKWLAAHYEKD